jgi:hypothetical protein
MKDPNMPHNFVDIDNPDADGRSGPVLMMTLELDADGTLVYPAGWDFDNAVWHVYVCQRRLDALHDEISHLRSRLLTTTTNPEGTR